jgi:hypothetical protein
MRTIEYRDIRPDGTLLVEWHCAEGYELGHAYAPGFRPVPPWERQRREPGGEWVTIFRVKPGQELLDAELVEHGPA